MARGGALSAVQRRDQPATSFWGSQSQLPAIYGLRERLKAIASHSRPLLSNKTVRTGASSQALMPVQQTISCLGYRPFPTAASGLREITWIKLEMLRH